MASKENKNHFENSAVINTFKAQLIILKQENKKLSDENHLLRIKMAADAKKLVMVRDWITNFNELSGHLKEIAKDWEEIAPVENNANQSNPVVTSNVDPRPTAAGLRVMLNRTKLTPRMPTTPTKILQASMLGRLQKNIQDKEINDAAKAPGPSSSIVDDLLDVEIKTEQVDEEYKQIVVAPVEPVPKKTSTTSVESVEPSQKVAEKTVTKRKALEEPKMRQTRSKAKAINDEEPNVKRYRLVTSVPVLKTDDDGDGPMTVSRTKSDGGKTIKRSKVLTKRSTNY